VNDSFPSLDEQMTTAVHRQLDHIAASHRVDRGGWTREQWVADARRLFEDLDGSVLDLVNGHVVYMLNEIDVLKKRLAELESAGPGSPAGLVEADEGGVA
jgi:hypothetical protein